MLAPTYMTMRAGKLMAIDILGAGCAPPTVPICTKQLFAQLRKTKMLCWSQLRPRMNPTSSRCREAQLAASWSNEAAATHAGFRCWQPAEAKKPNSSVQVDRHLQERPFTRWAIAKPFGHWRLGRLVVRLEWNDPPSKNSR